MPTVQQIRDLADSMDITWTEKMTKSQLLELVGAESALSIDYATDIHDAINMKGWIRNKKVYKKVWEERRKGNMGLYIGVFVNEEDVIVVKGTSIGNGLGLGGPKWHYTSKSI